MLDAVVHGCVPVVLQDESDMFFEGSFAAAGLPFDYANFSLRLPEVELPRLLQHIDAVPPARLASMQRAVHAARDYFVYKDVYSPYKYHRRDFLGAGREGQDAFLLLTLALEARARALGKLPGDETRWRARNRALLGLEVEAKGARF